MPKHLPHFHVFVRLAPSKIHGVGVVAIRTIPKGTSIFYGDNENLVWLKKTAVQDVDKEVRLLYRDFCVEKNGMYGCPANFNRMTPAWYLNHSSKPNVEADKEYRFFAKRRIRKGEELTVDYRTYSNVSHYLD